MHGSSRLVSHDHSLPSLQVGTPRWQAQHDAISQLNIQAHHNARSNSDEFVVDLLVSLDKVGVLVHDLLVIEAWKEKLLAPHLMGHIADHVDTASSYMLLFHECNVANLIEITLFHSKVCESIPEEYLLELADWTYRKLAFLNSKEATRFSEESKLEAMSVKDMLSQTPLDEMRERSRELDFAAAMQSLSITRYLSDQLSTAPMGLLSRLVTTNDTLMALIPLLEKPPWIRRRVVGGKGPLRTERWEASGSSHWAVVEASDRLKLGQNEIQMWLTINNLLVDPKSRSKYVGTIDEYRKDKILGLRRHLNELMFDQLPVLKDLQRMLDELSLGGGGAGDREASKQAGLILEQVPVIRDGMVRGREWKKEAERQAGAQFKKGAGMDQKRAELLSKLMDQFCDLEMEEEASKKGKDLNSNSVQGPKGSLPGPIKVECRRKVHESGVWEPWCGFELTVDPSKHPDPVEVSAPAPASGREGGPAPTSVHGLRYKLLAINPDESCPEPLPSNGKIIVKVPLPSTTGEKQVVISQALLQLPDVPLKDQASELPSVVWVTVGLLAVDGIALQVKLKRDDKPKQRDRVSGVWYCYRPVGGALTVIRGDRSEVKSSPAAAKIDGSRTDSRPIAAISVSPKPGVQLMDGEGTNKEASAAGAAHISMNKVVVKEAAEVQFEDDLNLPD